MKILKRQGKPVSSILPKKLFKFWHSIFLSVLILLSLPVSNAHPAQVTLAWDASTDPNVAGYKVNYGTSSGSYQAVIDVGNLTTCTISNLLDGTTYYFAATDYNTSGIESGYSNEVVSNPPPPCTSSISPTTQSFDSSGGPGTVSVTAQTGCTWAANSNASWLIITSNSTGTGSGTVYYSVSVNSGTGSRIGTLTISGKSFTVNQAGVSSCSSTLAPIASSFAASGGMGLVSVNTTAGCNWTAASNASWITITSGQSGSGNDTVFFSVAANSGTSSRTGTVTIAGKIYLVSQGGGSCSYIISPNSNSFSASGGTGSVSVNSASGCSWTAVSNASWIAITSGQSGSGSGTVNYSVAANSGTSSRTGTVTIAGNTFTVSQGGGSCSYTISPTSNSFSASGGTGSVSVNSASGCNWTATSNASWIAITSGQSGSGSGTVNYSVAANSGTSSRTGTVTIAGNTFTVSQGGGSCDYSISPAYQFLTGDGGPGNINVTSSSGCSWGAISNVSWITINSGATGSGSGQVNYSVSPNDTTVLRKSTISVAGKEFSITQFPQ